MRRGSQIVRVPQRRRTYSVCYRPPYCKKVDLDFGFCAALSTYNFYTSISCKIDNYQRLGDAEKIEEYGMYVNRLNHLISFLTLARYQSMVTGDKIDKYVDCKFIECLRKEFLCWGLDIVCILECFGVCGYCKDCGLCKDYGGDFYGGPLPFTS